MLHRALPRRSRYSSAAAASPSSLGRQLKPEAHGTSTSKASAGSPKPTVARSTQEHLPRVVSTRLRIGLTSTTLGDAITRVRSRRDPAPWAFLRLESVGVVQPVLG